MVVHDKDSCQGRDTNLRADEINIGYKASPYIGLCRRLASNCPLWYKARARRQDWQKRFA